MRRIIIGIIVLAALWGGYWIFGATALNQRAEAWLEELRADGWLIEADVSVAGFPNRFDLTLEDIEIVDPDSDFVWEAPHFQVIALSYRPNHLIFAWPDEQVIDSPWGRMTTTADEMLGSIRFRRGSDREVEDARIAIDGLEVDTTLGWRAGAESILLTLKRSSEQQPVYLAAIKVENPHIETPHIVDETASAQAMAPLEGAGLINVETIIKFSAPWTHPETADEIPVPVEIEIDKAEARWGDIDLSVQGSLHILPNGAPHGRIALKINDWRGALQRGVDAGYVTDEHTLSLANFLSIFAGGNSGDENALEVPLTFDRGNLNLGFIPLGQAPRFFTR